MGSLPILSKILTTFPCYLNVFFRVILLRQFSLSLRGYNQVRRELEAPVQKRIIELENLKRVMGIKTEKYDFLWYRNFGIWLQLKLLVTNSGLGDLSNFVVSYSKIF